MSYWTQTDIVKGRTWQGELILRSPVLEGAEDWIASRAINAVVASPLHAGLVKIGLPGLSQDAAVGPSRHFAGKNNTVAIGGITDIK
jgi:hypothetical protein